MNKQIITVEGSVDGLGEGHLVVLGVFCDCDQTGCFVELTPDGVRCAACETIIPEAEVLTLQADLHGYFCGFESLVQRLNDACDLRRRSLARPWEHTYMPCGMDDAAGYRLEAMADKARTQLASIFRDALKWA